MVSLQTWRSYKMDTLVGWKSIKWHGILFTHSHPRNEKTQITKSFIFFWFRRGRSFNQKDVRRTWPMRMGKKWTIQILCFKRWVGFCQNMVIFIPWDRNGSETWWFSFHAWDRTRKEYPKKTTKKLNINPSYYLSQILGDSHPKSPTWLDFGGSESTHFYKTVSYKQLNQSMFPAGFPIPNYTKISWWMFLPTHVRLPRNTSRFLKKVMVGI